MEFYSSTYINYKELRALPVRYLYGQFSITFDNTFITDKITAKQVNIQENRAYDMHVSHTKKNIRNEFIDYLGPINFSAITL